MSESRRMFDLRNVNSAWAHMWRGMRAYGVAITVIWTMSTTSVLAVFAVAVNGAWLKAALGSGAVLELVCCWLTLAFLIRASNAGRFDT
jgi:thiosulfate reductase cytochrome b subunit